jgi:hypothetical protein
MRAWALAVHLLSLAAVPAMVHGAVVGSVTNPASSCESILSAGMQPSGAFWLRIGTAAPFLTLCDFTEDGGGWTLVASLAQATNPSTVSTLAAWGPMDASNDTAATRMYKVRPRPPSMAAGRWCSLVSVWFFPFFLSARGTPLGTRRSQCTPHGTLALPGVMSVPWGLCGTLGLVLCGRGVG